MSMDKEVKKALKKDGSHNGRDQYFVDIDRMVSEGLAGGTVDMEDGQIQIGEVQDLEKEAPPNRTE
jgi:hypothetical protein